jgi:hypothetical protein
VSGSPGSRLEESARRAATAEGEDVAASAYALCRSSRAGARCTVLVFPSSVVPRLLPFAPSRCSCAFAQQCYGCARVCAGVHPPSSHFFAGPMRFEILLPGRGMRS